MPRFSVIIPLYNKAPYVGKTVESVLGQTFGDYELIIIDNGSNDGSHEIVAAFTDHRIKIVRLEENSMPTTGGSPLSLKRWPDSLIVTPTQASTAQAIIS